MNPQNDKENNTNLKSQKLFGPNIRLNVGGVKYHTSRGTLMQCPSSMLARMFSGTWTVHEDEGYAFIDRDGTRFRHILNYLRNRTVPAFEDEWRFQEVLEEADFFGLPDLRDLVEAKISQMKAQRAEERAEDAKSSGQVCQVMILGNNGDSPRDVIAQALRNLDTQDPLEEHRRDMITRQPEFTMDEEF
eukprot:CAMPEP_0185754850 /NCGR_PEP_ID=MMETSP1174-20130828/13437_1 /TAXON_ID=35687 /ORGANISM="Dictyocha speculum, Strain CCMP1381" /LENGTH=188 /DNA_ID=CAMNT_0028433225 /DNA_START=82 /DNA_END=648 /DNA_ORIENTATION=+